MTHNNNNNNSNNNNNDNSNNNDSNNNNGSNINDNNNIRYNRYTNVVLSTDPMQDHLIETKCSISDISCIHIQSFVKKASSSFRHTSTKLLHCWRHK